MNHGEGCEEVSPQQVIDFTHHCRNNIAHEFISIIKYFQEKVESDPDFFFASEVDNAGTLRSIFWANARAISSCLSFCDMIVFDTIYRTNHLNLLFSPFTRVNHHRRSIWFGLHCLRTRGIHLFGYLINGANACTELHEK